jgi:predicted nucleotidyltransferase component of viral defense system
MRIKPKELTPDISTEWASLAQQRFLDALMSDPELQCKGIAFHGGTSLHLSWRSQRFSEDLDFLLSDHFDTSRVLKRAERRLREFFLADDPDFAIEIKDKTRDEGRMVVFHIMVSNGKFIGKSMIKAEFWKVDQSYLDNYPVEFRSPMKPGDMVSKVSNPVPAASLETAYCDKLTAFATRPFVKWRDIYDLWWIGTQTDSKLDIDQVRKQFLHNVSAYNTVGGLPPQDALLEFTRKNNKDDLFVSAERDLKRWLPPNLWASLYPNGVRQMIDYTFSALNAIGMIDECSASPKVNLKRPGL